MAELTFAEVGEILSLLERIEGAEVTVEWGDLKVCVRRGGGAPASPVAVPDLPPASQQTAEVAPSTEPAAAASSAGPVPDTGRSGAEPGEDIAEHWVPVRAPMVGTFYRAAKPGEPPFVEVGDPIAAGDTVGLIEVMKLYTELTSDIAGKVARIGVEDSDLVEHGQPLLWIEPA